jgi:hypothetical protein
MKLPGAVIFTNNDLNEASYTKLTAQLHLTEIITKSEFDSRISNDPSYPTIVKGLKFRILVTLPTMQDLSNRESADVVMFIKNGIASILKNNFGPPGFQYSIERMNVYEILRYNLSDEVKFYPNISNQQSNTCCSNSCNCSGFKQLFQTNNSNEVFCANPDNIYNNTDFKNRK